MNAGDPAIAKGSVQLVKVGSSAMAGRGRTLRVQDGPECFPVRGERASGTPLGMEIE
jgi:hypothetical protein